MKKLIVGNASAETLLDDDIYEIALNTNWFMNNAGYVMGHGYTTDEDGNKVGISVPLHRYVYTLVHGQIPNKMTIDHINGDKLDNRIENLRLATMSHQQANTRKKEGCTVDKKGVYTQTKIVKHKDGTQRECKYYVARVKEPNSSSVRTKCFPFTEEGLESAANWYDDNSRELYGTFAFFNNPVRIKEMYDETLLKETSVKLPDGTPVEFNVNKSIVDGKLHTDIIVMAVKRNG